MAWREALRKPVAKPTAPKPKFDTKDDDWETDITYENQTNEKSQRYGSSSVPGTGRIDHVDFKTIQQKVKTADSSVKEVYQEKNPNRGYGGRYGTDQVMDKSAADFSYRADVPKHPSQTDGKKGFGGVYGIDERAKDKSAVGFDYRAQVDKHPSQTDFSKGFGGKFGTDSNAQDKSAVGFSHRETVEKHPSQKDYNVGFGGKYGIQKEEPSRLSAPKTPPSERKNTEESAPPIGSSIGVGNIRARFENMKKEQEEDAAKRVAEERNKRAVNDHQSTSNGHDKIKQQQQQQQEISSISNQQPSSPPPPIYHQQEVRSSIHEQEVSHVQISNPSIYENFGNQFETERSTTNEGESNRFVGNVDVSSLLKQRKISASSSKHDDDDEWADDHNSYNHQHPERRSPSPVPVVQSSTDNNNNGNHINEGIRCIARYSYQKTEDDELGFEENDIITNIQKMHDEWWFGKIGTRSGLFPANYVEEL